MSKPEETTETETTEATETDNKKKAIAIINAYRLQVAQHVAKLDKENLLEYLERAELAAEKAQVDFTFAARMLSKKHNLNVKAHSTTWNAPSTEARKNYKVSDPSKPAKTQKATLSKRGKNPKEKAIVDMQKFFMTQGNSQSEALTKATSHVEKLMGGSK